MDYIAHRQKVFKMEQDKKERLLGGETTFTPTSDEAIEATLKDLRLQLGGLPDPEVIIEGDQLPPRLMGGSNKLNKDETSSTTIADIGSKLSHKNSALALKIHQAKQDKKVA